MSVSIDIQKLRPAIAEFDFNKYKEKLSELNVLQKGKFPRGESNGLFDDKLWVTIRDNHDTYAYYDFSTLDKLRFYGFNTTHLNLIKCWLVDRIEKRDLSHITTDLTYIFNFLLESCFLNEDVINEDNGFFVKDFFDDLEVKNDTKSYFKTVLISFFDFNIKSGLVNTTIWQKYLKQIQELKYSSAYENNGRDLPSTRNILLLGSYIDMFFSENKNDLATYYMPVLLWWKITNVIPMRPSELAKKLPRDCLVQKDGLWYLKVNRSKLREDNTGGSLPIITEFQISDDIVKLIEEYKELTKGYGKTETLISYPAYSSLKNILYKENNHHMTNLGNKIVKSRFSSNILQRLLEDFYKYIILEKYNVDLTNDMVNLGDTRHFAILSLILQGYSRIEVALMSGHTSLRSNEHYYSNIEYYLDSEVYKLIYDRLQNVDNNESYATLENIKKVVSSMPENPPKPLDQMGELDVGYCMCNFKEDSCESVRCYKCRKWWCEPTVENYKAKVELVTKEHYVPKKEKLQKNVDEFIELLALYKPFISEDLDGNKIISENPFNYDEIKTKSKAIAFLAKEVIDTQMDLIDIDALKTHMDSIISDILYIHESEDKEKFYG